MKLNMTQRVTLVAMAAVIGFAGLAQAEAIEGLWKTEPDRKGQVGYVKIAPCGSGYCGTIVKAFDASGKPVITKNVGKQIITGMKAKGGGAYEGRVFVPVLGRTVDGKVSVSGSKMKLSGCLAIGCATQSWRRVK